MLQLPFPLRALPVHSIKWLVPSSSSSVTDSCRLFGPILMPDFLTSQFFTGAHYTHLKLTKQRLSFNDKKLFSKFITSHSKLVFDVMSDSELFCSRVLMKTHANKNFQQFVVWQCHNEIWLATFLLLLSQLVRYLSIFESLSRCHTFCIGGTHLYPSQSVD